MSKMSDEELWQEIIRISFVNGNPQQVIFDLAKRYAASQRAVVPEDVEAALVRTFSDEFIGDEQKIIRAHIAAQAAEIERLRGVVGRQCAEVTAYRSALKQIKEAQERNVSGEVAKGVPAYKMLECWNIADKALAPSPAEVKS